MQIQKDCESIIEQAKKVWIPVWYSINGTEDRVRIGKYSGSLLKLIYKDVNNIIHSYELNKEQEYADQINYILSLYDIKLNNLSLSEDINWKATGSPW